MTNEERRELLRQRHFTRVTPSLWPKIIAASAVNALLWSLVFFGSLIYTTGLKNAQFEQVQRDIVSADTKRMQEWAEYKTEHKVLEAKLETKATYLETKIENIAAELKDHRLKDEALWTRH